MIFCKTDSVPILKQIIKLENAYSLFNLDHVNKLEISKFEQISNSLKHSVKVGNSLDSMQPTSSEGIAGAKHNYSVTIQPKDRKSRKFVNKANRKAKPSRLN